MEKKEIVRFYFDTITYHTQLEQWYRAFVLTFEAIFFAAAVYVYIADPFPGEVKGIRILTLLVIVGLVFSVLAVLAGLQRGNIVDRQRKKLEEIIWNKGGNRKVPNDELAECFEMYNPADKTKVLVPRAQNWVPRLIFNFFINVSIGSVLIFFLLDSIPARPLGIYFLVIGVYVIALGCAFQFFSRLGVPKDRFEKKQIKQRWLKWLNPIVNFGLKE